MAALTPALADELLDAMPGLVPALHNDRLIREALRDIALGRVGCVAAPTGEYICRKCGLRQNSETSHADF